MKEMITLKTFDRSPSLAELKVSYRRKKTTTPNQLCMPWRITSAQTAEEYLRSIWNPETIELLEDFYVICLNGAHATLGWVRLSSGGFNATVVDSRMVFAVALQAASSAIIVAHNHPSGQLEPSPEDRAITNRLKEAGELLRLPLLDHIILSKESAFSFADNGLL